MLDRVMQLQFGSEIFDLNSVGLEEGGSLLVGGGGGFAFTPHRLDAILRSEQSQLTEEKFQLAFWARRGVEITAKLSRLWKILRAAWRYTSTGRQRTPVYLVVKPKGRGNPQYALVHSCPQASGPSPIGAQTFDGFLRSVQEAGLTILHYPWQDGPPGELPASLLTLVATDGPANPTRCMVANFRDTVEVTHVYNYDASAPVVLNPGFEDPGGGGADIWANWGEFAGDGALANETTLVHSGSDAAKLTAGATVNTGIWTDAIAVSAGTNYLLSFWTRGDGANPGRFSIWDNTNSVWIIGSTPTGIPGTTYSQYVQPFSTPVGCVEILVYLLCPSTAGGIAYFDDVSLAVSQNLVAEIGWTVWSVAGQTPADEDVLYIGAPRPWHHWIPSIATAGDYNCDIAVEYWNGAWVAAAIDSKCTLFPTGNEDSVFKRAGDWAINPGALWDWATTAINGVTAYWIRLRINAFTAMAQAPVVGATAPYTQRKPFIEIPAVAIGGDTLPHTLLRLYSAYGGDDDEGYPNLSKIIMGAKSEDAADPTLDDFEPFLNWSDEGNPAGWACAAGTDGSFAADTLAPTGRALNVDFAGDASLTVRGTLTGTAKVKPCAGVYRMFLRCRQVGGAAGDVSVAVFTRLLSTSTQNPATKTATAALGMVDTDDIELVDFGVLTLPFGPIQDSDDLTNMNLIFQVYAQRSAGAATLRIYDLILIPINEWSNAPFDPLGDTTYGSSALRGDTLLEMDSGIIRPRLMKMRAQATGEPQPMETWNDGGPFPQLQPATRYRIWFLMLHFRSGGQWGTGPWAANLGAMLAFEMYARNRYLLLRGEG